MNSPITQYFADRFVRKEILSYDVMCLHLEKGCTWRGKFAEFEVCTPVRPTMPA